MFVNQNNQLLQFSFVSMATQTSTCIQNTFLPKKLSPKTPYCSLDRKSPKKVKTFIQLHNSASISKFHMSYIHHQHSELIKKAQNNTTKNFLLQTSHLLNDCSLPKKQPQTKLHKKVPYNRPIQFLILDVRYGESENSGRGVFCNLLRSTYKGTYPTMVVRRLIKMVELFTAVFCSQSNVGQCIFVVKIYESLQKAL